MKFKTKPIEIEAWRWDCGEPMPEILFDMLVHGGLRLPRESNGNIYNDQHKTTISFNKGDWLIYSNGPDDIYPCSDEVFQKKYEGA